MEPRSNILEERPPWDLYPGEPPYSIAYRQGNPEFYLHYGWLPFWRTLSAAQKEEYLRHWNAPEEWKDYCHEIDAGVPEMTEDEYFKWLEEGKPGK